MIKLYQIQTVLSIYILQNTSPSFHRVIFIRSVNMYFICSSKSDLLFVIFAHVWSSDGVTLRFGKSKVDGNLQVEYRSTLLNKLSDL